MKEKTTFRVNINIIKYADVIILLFNLCYWKQNYKNEFTLAKKHNFKILYRIRSVEL